MSDIVQAQLLFLDSVEKKDITLYINSPGGSVLCGLGIVDLMNYISSDVATVNIGMCASMGSVLLSSGTKGKRSSLIYSKVMTHQVSHGTQGNLQDTRINQMEAEKYNYILFKMLAQNCGKTFDEMIESSRRDKWFNSDEALKFGLIDELRKEYESLLEEYEWNKIIYESDLRFEPVVGEIYHLYQNDGKKFISLIGPGEWDKEYLGTFKFGHDLKWEKL